MNFKCKYCKNPFIKSHNNRKFCSIKCSNRYNLNNKIILKISKKHSVELAELFGILLGDGSVTKYYVKIYLNMKADVKYSAKIIKIIKKLFPKLKPTVHIRPARGTEEIQISSKEICDYLRSVGFNPKIRSIPRWIVENENFTKATLKGLFDTEGSIGIKYFKGKHDSYIYKQLTFTNTNKNIKKFVRNSLLKFGFKPTQGLRNNIYISNNKDIEKYFKVIGASNPKLEKKFKIK